MLSCLSVLSGIIFISSLFFYLVPFFTLILESKFNFLLKNKSDKIILFVDGILSTLTLTVFFPSAHVTYLNMMNCLSLNLKTDADIFFLIAVIFFLVMIFDAKINHVENNENKREFCVAFSVIFLHSFFDGLSLAFQKNSKNLIPLFIGIISHRIFVAMAIGAKASVVCLPRKIHGFLAFLFASSFVAGVFYANYETQQNNGCQGKIAEAFFNATASAFFLYTIFVRRIGKNVGNVKNCICIFLGGLATIFLHFIVDD